MAIEGIKGEYDKIFLPYEVCDRIAVKNGKITFIEVKKKVEKLREKQKEFSKIVKKKYRIVFI